jgi:predicted enzyme related to lactoylglutathione lyase
MAHHGDYGHIDIPADDLGRAQRFYEEVFGWAFTTAPDSVDYRVYSTPAGEHAVGGAIGKRNDTVPGRIRTYVNVNSIRQALPRVLEYGGSIVKPRAELPGQGWYAIVTDSEGNEFGLWESLL